MLSWRPKEHAPNNGYWGSEGQLDQLTGSVADLTGPKVNRGYNYTWFHIRTTKAQDKIIRDTMLAIRKGRKEHFNFATNNCAVVVARAYHNAGSPVWWWLTGIPWLDYHTLKDFGVPIWPK